MPFKVFTTANVPSWWEARDDRLYQGVTEALEASLGKIHNVF